MRTKFVDRASTRGGTYPGRMVVDEVVLNSDDEVNDLTSPDGFADDLERVRRLQALLGYA